MIYLPMRQLPHLPIIHWRERLENSLEFLEESTLVD